MLLAFCYFGPTDWLRDMCMSWIVFVINVVLFSNFVRYSLLLSLSLIYITSIPGIDSINFNAIKILVCIYSFLPHHEMYCFVAICILIIIKDFPLFILIWFFNYSEMYSACCCFCFFLQIKYINYELNLVKNNHIHSISSYI